MDGWVGGWVDGWMDGWMGGWKDCGVANRERWFLLLRDKSCISLPIPFHFHFTGNQCQNLSLRHTVPVLFHV